MLIAPSRGGTTTYIFDLLLGRFKGLVLSCRQERGQRGEPRPPPSHCTSNSECIGAVICRLMAALHRSAVSTLERSREREPGSLYVLKQLLPWRLENWKGKLAG